MQRLVLIHLHNENVIKMFTISVLQHTENPKFPLLPNGDKIPYKPDWFQGHPIKQKGHSEIVYIPNRNEKFSGFMNIADGARFVYFLCAK